METSRFEQQMRFLVEIDQMKNVLRQTLLADGSRRESDAEHSWHLAMYAMLLSEYAPEPVDISRVVRMVLVHDLIEIYAGDTFCYDKEGNRDKAAREAAAADRLTRCFLRIRRENTVRCGRNSTGWIRRIPVSPPRSTAFSRSSTTT